MTETFKSGACHTRKRKRCRRDTDYRFTARSGQSAVVSGGCDRIDPMLFMMDMFLMMYRMQGTIYPSRLACI